MLIAPSEGLGLKPSRLRITLLRIHNHNHTMITATVAES